MAELVPAIESTPNVYYELGYAEGLSKPLIVTAKKDTPLPFDTKDIPVIFWEAGLWARAHLHPRDLLAAAVSG